MYETTEVLLWIVLALLVIITPLILTILARFNDLEFEIKRLRRLITNDKTRN